MRTLISVVMPAHDEEDFLAASVEEVVLGLRGRRDFEVRGGRERVVRRHRRGGGRSWPAELPEVRCISLAEADYGAALRQGFLAATGESVVIFDVDYYDLGFLDQALAVLERPGGPAIVVGSKRGPGADGHPDVEPPARHLGLLHGPCASASAWACRTPTA